MITDLRNINLFYTILHCMCLSTLYHIHRFATPINNNYCYCMTLSHSIQLQNSWAMQNVIVANLNAIGSWYYPVWYAEWSAVWLIWSSYIILSSLWLISRNKSVLLTHEIIERVLTKSILPSLQISQLIIVDYNIWWG